MQKKRRKKDEKELFKQSCSIGHDSVHGGDPGSAGHAGSSKSTDCSAQINLAGSQKENRLDVSIRHRFSSSAPDGNDRVAGL